MYHKQKTPKMGLIKIYKTIVRPIQNQVIVTNIFRADKLGKEIAELGKDISVQYGYLKKLTIEFRLDYRKFSVMVKESQDRLVEARGKIKWD